MRLALTHGPSHALFHASSPDSAVTVPLSAL